MKLDALFLGSQSKTAKATMTEVEEFARWFAELTVTAVEVLADGKISFSDYPRFMASLWGAKEAFTGINKFGEEFKQAKLEDYIHLKDAVLSALTASALGSKIPKDYIDLIADTAVQNVKLFTATKELIKK